MLVNPSHARTLLEWDSTHLSYRFVIRLNNLSRLPQSPWHEAIVAAQAIGSAQREISLCVSGGVDSEAMAQAFVAAQVPFQFVVWRFHDDLNRHDTDAACELAENLKVPVHFIDFDVTQFYRSPTLRHYAENYHTYSPERAVQIALLEQTPGFPVIAGEILFGHDDGTFSFVCPDYQDFYLQRYLQKRNRSGVANFHWQTTELLFSFWHHTDIHLHTKEDWKGRGEELYQFKKHVYRRGGFPVTDLQNRQRKFHGFELVKDFFDQELQAEHTDYQKKYRDPLLSCGPQPISSQLQIDFADPFIQAIFRDKVPGL